MKNAEETKRNKARQLRYKKPIVRDLNLDSITQNLWDIQAVKEIEKLYEAVSEDAWTRDKHSTESRDWERYTDALPPEAWIA